MDNCFDVFMNGHTVGKVILKQKGLFYELECICRIQAQKRYHLILRGDGNELDFGLCVPYSNGFGLKTRVAQNKIGLEAHVFELSTKEITDKSHNTVFYPVYENEPFTYLEKLKYALFTKQDGMSGVVFNNQN